MEQREILARLAMLARVDEEAVRVYDAALDRLEDAEGRDRLMEFRGDHTRHAKDIRRMAERNNAQLPGAKPQVTALMNDCIDAVLGATSDDEVLAALMMAEHATNMAYAESLPAEVPPEVCSTIEGNLADEERHLEYVEQRVPVGAAAGVRPASGRAKVPVTAAASPFEMRPESVREGHEEGE